MAAVILYKPKIKIQSPRPDLRFKIVEGKVVSEDCQLTIEVDFAYGLEMNCAISIRVDRSSMNYFMIEPNSSDSNEYEILRYYGRVRSGKTDTFNFYLKSEKSLEEIKAYSKPVFIVVTVFDCDYRDAKKTETAIWKIRI